MYIYTYYLSIYIWINTVRWWTTIHIQKLLVILVLYCPYGFEHFLRRPWLLSRSSAVWGDATHHKQRFRLGFKTKQQLHTQNGN